MLGAMAISTAAETRQRTRPRRIAGRHLLLASVLAVAGIAAQSGPVDAVTCGGTAPTVSRPGTVVVADSFESGSLWSHWSVTDEGDAWAGITTSAYRGRCAGRVIVTSSWNSRANMRHGLPSGTANVWAVGYFRVDKQGYWGSNVPTFRFFDGTRRILDVYRSNGTGDMWIRTATGNGSWRYTRLNRQLALHEWIKLEVHVRTNWGSSTVEVWINGIRRYYSSSYSLPTSRLTTVMVGAEHIKQLGDFSVDDVVVTRL